MKHFFVIVIMFGSTIYCIGYVAEWLGSHWH